MFNDLYNELTSGSVKYFINSGWKKPRLFDDAINLKSQTLSSLDPLADIDTMEVDRIPECLQPSGVNKEFEKEKEICRAKDSNDESNWDLEEA